MRRSFCVLTVDAGAQGADSSHILPRDSLAEIMAAEEVVAAKQQLHAAQLAQRANSFESSATNPPHAGAPPAAPVALLFPGFAGKRPIGHHRMCRPAMPAVQPKTKQSTTYLSVAT